MMYCVILFGVVMRRNQDNEQIQLAWWKVVTIILLYYTVIGGFLIPVPRLHILNETIRMNYFHVPMWFAMISLFAYSVWSSIQYLRTA